MLAEDDESVRKVASTLLRSQGYKVLEAADGPAALSLLAGNEPIDLLFTDLIMPGGMSGADLVRQARERHPNLKTLFTSGYAETGIFKKADLETSADILHKPYRQEELAKRIRRALDAD